MKTNIVQFAFISLAIVLGSAVEDMLPPVGSVGVPLLLALAVFFATVTRTPVWVLAAVAAGAFEEALSSQVPVASIVFFVAIAGAVRFLRMPFAWAAVAYPAYQIWLALVSPDGAGAFGRVLMAIPVGAVVLAVAFAVLSWLWRKAGADA